MLFLEEKIGMITEIQGEKYNFEVLEFQSNTLITAITRGRIYR